MNGQEQFHPKLEQIVTKKIPEENLSSETIGGRQEIIELATFGTLIKLPSLKNAACKDPQVDPNIFYTGGTNYTNKEAAKEICQNCPERVSCLTYAVNTDQPMGIWGGMTPKERKSLKDDLQGKKSIDKKQQAITANRQQEKANKKNKKQEVIIRRQKVIELRNQGLTSEKIATITGSPLNTIKSDIHILKKQGIELQQTKNGRRPSPEVAARRQKIMALRNQGLTSEKIATITGEPLSTIKNDIHRFKKQAVEPQQTKNGRRPSSEVAALIRKSPAISQDIYILREEDPIL
jgi:WhiB family redox-sensing transcriptional regulator